MTKRRRQVTYCVAQSAVLKLPQRCLELYPALMSSLETARQKILLMILFEKEKNKLNGNGFDNSERMNRQRSMNSGFG